MKGLLQKARKMFGFGIHEEPSAEANHSEIHGAIEKQREVGERADKLNAVLRGYLEAENPFKAFATDVFENVEEFRRTPRAPTQ